MMTIRTFLIRCLCAVVFLGVAGLPDQAWAATKKKNKKSVNFKTKGKAAELPKVTSVGNGSITVRGKYYEVPDDAVIIVNGQAASLSRIKTGMQAMVTGRVLHYGRGGDDNIYEAKKIVASNDNNLAKKAADFNKKARENAKKKVQNNNRNNRNRR